VDRSGATQDGAAVGADLRAARRERPGVLQVCSLGTAGSEIRPYQMFRFPIPEDEDDDEHQDEARFNIDNYFSKFWLSGLTLLRVRSFCTLMCNRLTYRALSPKPYSIFLHVQH